MNEPKPDGGPTFPYSALQPDEKTRQLVGSMYADNQGMSLRDWFAGMALQGFVRGKENPLSYGENISTLALLAYSMADAMLKERERV